MDLWVVAAAAGAGCLAKYWNRLSKNGDSSGILSSEVSNFEIPEFPSSPFCRQARRDKLDKDVSLDRRAFGGKPSDVNSPDGLLTVQLPSNKGIDSEKTRGFQYSESDILSISNLPLSSSSNGDLQDIEAGNKQSSNSGESVDNHGFLLRDSSAGEVGPIHNSSGVKKISLRMKHAYGHINRPVNSIESCLMAQLYKEHAEMEEEYVYSSLSSPSMAMRSFLVSDGIRIISRTNDNSFSALIGSKECKLNREACQVENEYVFGVPSLPEIGSFNDAKKMKFKRVIGRSQRLNSSNDVFSGKHIHTQHDTTTFFFSLGISFGIMSSIMSNKREIDQLRALLKQSENLVQDLQEELEMKDSLTVKELHNENYGSQGTCDRSFYDKELNGFSPGKHTDNSPVINCKVSYDQKEEESSGSMSKIEAELEAELERLGLNMNTSSLDRKLSGLVEVDPDFVADFAQGELKADTVSGKDFVHPKSKEDVSDITTPCGNFAVSPHELSLRLYEVIQSQLEERVKELDIALQNSQKKVRLLESRHEDCFQKTSSFTRGNQFTYDNCDPMAQPLVLNLSGEALDAYNEAYEELTKMDNSEENSPTGIYDHHTDHKEGSCSHVLGVQHGEANDSVIYTTVNGETLSSELSSNHLTVLEGLSSSVYDFNVTEDENCGCDYEEERQLIRLIVERTKKGSPVFHNAQRILCCMDEDEH